MLLGLVLSATLVAPRQALSAAGPTAVTGIYNGLFSVASGVTEQTAGMLRGLTVRQNGTYSGTLLINGKSHFITGSFNAANQAANSIARAPSQGGPLQVQMTLSNASNAPPQVTGLVSGTTNGVAWTANLIADFATNSLSAARYTMLIPPCTNNAPPDASPGGDGYALIANNAGRISLTGALADGTAFSQTTTVSQDGYVPIFANLYVRKGLLLGWINLDLTNTTGVSLAWIHPKRTSGLYRTGFTNLLFTNQILLSPWTNPPANIGLLTDLSVLGTVNDTNALIDFTVTMNGNRFDDVSDPSLLSGLIGPGSGRLKVVIGARASKLTGYGAILANATNGGGFYLTRTNAQAITIRP
jgi:hypothetical protein